MTSIPCFTRSTCHFIRMSESIQPIWDHCPHKSSFGVRCPAFKDTFLLGNCAIRILRFSSPGRSSFTAVWKHRPSQLHNTNPGLALKSLNLLEWAPSLTPKENYLKIPKANPSSLFQDCVQGKVWRLPRVTPGSRVWCQQVCWECFNGSWAIV